MGEGTRTRALGATLHRLGGALLRHLVPLAIVGLVLLGLWAVVVRLNLWPPYLFPGPGEVAAAFRSLGEGGSLSRALGASLYRLGVGFGLSLLLGATLALAMVHFRALGRALQPYVLGLQTFPSIAWVPLSILWFGFSEAALLFVVLMGSIFAVTIGFVDALRTVQPSFLRAARNMGCEGFDLIVKVSIPATVPHLISAVKAGWAFAWRSLIGAEIIFATAGLGFLLNQGRETDISEVVAMMFTILALGVIFDRMVFSWAQEWVGRRWGLIPGR